MIRTQLVSLLLFSFCVLSLNAQSEELTLSKEDIHRLNIQFAPVSKAVPSDGTALPAEIISPPNSQASLVAIYEGILTRWLVEPGQEVRKNQRVAIISSPAVVELQQQWLQRFSEFTQANNALSRDQALFEAGVIAKKRLLQTRQLQQQAQFALTAASATLRLAGYSGAQQHALTSDSAILGEYFVTAPVDGKLARLTHLSGEVVSAQAIIGELTQNSLPWVKASVPFYIASQLKVGQPLGIVGSEITLTLKHIDSNVSSKNQTIAMLAEFNQSPDLYIGQVISVVFPSSAKGYWVPADALVRYGKLSLIFYPTSNGVSTLDVNAIPAGNGYLIQSDFQPEKVVVKGTALLKGMLLGMGGDE